MNTKLFFDIANEIGENRLLTKNIHDFEAKEQSVAMADIIAFGILDIAKKEFTGMTYEQWDEFKEKFLKLAHWDE